MAQLAVISAPRKPVSGAVWAELMRTRMFEANSPSATLSQLQQGSGCRVHIERHRQEVRLFGTSEAIEKAEDLIEQLAEKVTERVVMVPSGSMPTATAVQAVAHACG